MQMDAVMETSNDINAWKTVLKVFPLLKGVLSVDEHAETQYAAFQQINSAGLAEIVKNLIQVQWERLMPSVTDSFWTFFMPHSEKPCTGNGFDLFCNAVHALNDNFAPYVKHAKNLQNLMDISGVNELNYKATDAMDLLKIILHATLSSRLCEFDFSIAQVFYNVAFKVYLHESNEEEITCGGCQAPTENCTCQEIMHTFQAVNDILLELGLLEKLNGNILMELMQERIKAHVKETCDGNFETSYIEILENWSRNVVSGWLKHIFLGESETSMEIIKKFEIQLMHSLYLCYTNTRIDQLFNIIIEYPDSQPAVEDLRICLKKVDLQTELASRLKTELVTRLLHSGVNTVDVLTAYVSAIKALRLLDPTGVILEAATGPVRMYLRNREDTIKCIINSLIDDGPSELAEELIRAEKSTLSDTSCLDDSDHWTKWTPDPIGADSTKPSKSRRTSDVISMLVNIYGSKDLFVKEYTNLLAQRLLTATNNDTEKEYRYLELLKLRFGENELHTCEVMLKDIYDSKRINGNTTEALKDSLAFPTSAKILSAPFWPAFREETLELPELIQEHLEKFTKAYEGLKVNRTLCWKPHLGSVELEVALADRTVKVFTTPTRATVLWHFQSQERWTIEELSAVIKVPPMKLRRECAYWQSLGVLRESSNDCFEVLENKASGRATETPCIDEEAESVMASAQDQRKEELGVFWSYIVGMLTNLESMPLDRIHQMLKMFATQGPNSIDCSQVELQTFLDQKVREHQLLFSGGLYRLPKP